MNRISRMGLEWPDLGSWRFLLLLLFSLALSVSVEGEDFSCEKTKMSMFKENETGGLSESGKRSSQRSKTCRRCGVLIPRETIYVEVNKESKEVLCRFNDSFISTDDVYFKTKHEVLPHQVVNSTTIRTEIYHSRAQYYLLTCYLRRKKQDKKDKRLCSQYVKAGSPPPNVTNFSCLSRNNLDLKCTWTNTDPYFLNTVTNITFANDFLLLSPCPKTDNKTYCLWKQGEKFKLHDNFTLIITKENKFGTTSNSFEVNIPEIVIPGKPVSKVVIVEPLKANFTWNLTTPMDVFHYGLWHSVQMRIKGQSNWKNVMTRYHRYKISKFHNDQEFYEVINLPYANTKYEFRVRTHTGVGEIRENMWSQYDVLSLFTDPMSPMEAPEVSKSSFEVTEVLDTRDIFVNFKDVEKNQQGGPGFHYNVDVFSDHDQRVDVEPAEVTDAYIKYRFMNFTEYKFIIKPANDVGPSKFSAEVIVPNSDCMPKKTEMFTVITSSSEENVTYRLYWVPSRMSNELCPGSENHIDSYTIFWCKRATGFRCKKKLDWKDIRAEEIRVKDLSSFSITDITIYEHNITELSNDEPYSIGVAANSGEFSSGIRWSSCIVDKNEPPHPPVTEVVALTNDSSAVLVKWKLKCMSISAVPVGFNISYCQSVVEDFGHCISEVQHMEMKSPTASEAFISNLKSGTSYIFSVSVLSIIGEGTQSYPKKMMLRDEIPEYRLKNLWYEDVTNTSVSLAWELPDKVKPYGTVTEYMIEIFPQIKENMWVPAPQNPKANISYKVTNLKPFTKYNMAVVPCNSKGCGIKKRKVELHTLPGVPDNVENFMLITNGWFLTWDLYHCNSRNCSFEIQIPVNETDFRIVTIDDKETLNLDRENVTCNHTEMEFSIRAKGQDRSGNFLYGNWTTITKEPSECPPAQLSWWIICIIVFCCVVFSAVILLIVKLGWRTIIKGIKDCNQTITLPKGIQVAEPTKDPQKEFSSFSTKVPSSDRISDPPLLLLPSPSQRPVAGGDRGNTTKLRADSVSSEEVQLIDSSDQDRHGRNFSGSSEHSSGQDSALMSGCPSLSNPNEQLDNLSSEHSSQETTLRQRSPGPPYVQHGIVPDKITEGYVTAWSVPSLPHLYKEGLDSMQQSTPDLNESMFASNWQKARRASTGYISMPDSENDKESPSRGVKETLTDVALTNIPQSNNGYTGLPHYSRHSFNPEVKMESAKGGYVMLAEGRSPSPPSNGGSVGYVSAGDPFGSLKRPPSLPLIPKSVSVGESDLPLGAYCRVGSRGGNHNNQGYVSASRVGELMAQGGDKNPPYVSCGEAATMAYNNTSANPSKDGPSSSSSSSNSPPPSTFSPYVEIKDGGRWAHPRPPPLTSAPAEGGGGGGSRIGRVGHLPRPNTTEATMGHPRVDKNPSLSKQSSGYVSQETIAPPEGMLMSPKRLLTQTTVPHNIVVANSHQASMV